MEKYNNVSELILSVSVLGRSICCLISRKTKRELISLSAKVAIRVLLTDCFSYVESNSFS